MVSKFVWNLIIFCQNVCNLLELKLTLWHHYEIQRLVIVFGGPFCSRAIHWQEYQFPELNLWRKIDIVDSERQCSWKMEEMKNLWWKMMDHITNKRQPTWNTHSMSFDPMELWKYHQVTKRNICLLSKINRISNTLAANLTLICMEYKSMLDRAFYPENNKNLYWPHLVQLMW